LRADLDTVRHKLDVLRGHCESVGRDYDSVQKTLEFYTIVGDRREVDRVAKDTARRIGRDEEFVRTEWHEHPGDADQVAATIRDYAEAGIDYFIVNLPNAFEGGVISRFAEEIFPRVGLRATP
jgi:alkanesulfonate monooxygenase SsuD/methylene tetrahydromethanopterin reductase-like flavin-dependent oxidoreductase (luciferase family)